MKGRLKIMDSDYEKFRTRAIFSGLIIGLAVVLTVVIGRGCASHAGGEGTDGRVWFANHDQYQQTKMTGSFKTARGTELQGSIERRVDAEGIRATGDAVAKVVSEFNVSLDKAVAAKKLTLEAATEARRIAAESAAKVFGEVAKAEPKLMEKASSR